MRQTPRSFVPAPFEIRVFSLVLLALMSLVVACPLPGQTPPSQDNSTAQPAKPSDTPAQSPSAAEVVTRDSATTF